MNLYLINLIINGLDRSLVLPDDPELGLLLISSCPAQANAASPAALLCELHVLKPAVDPATRLFYKVINKEL